MTAATPDAGAGEPCNEDSGAACAMPMLTITPPDPVVSQPREPVLDTVLTMHESERPVTIYTVAAHAGVSIATVSRVLQGTASTSAATRDKVLRAVADLDYHPLRSGGHTALRLETHGLVLPGVAGSYWTELLSGYESSTPRFGQGVALLITTPDMPDARERVLDLSTKVDGMVIGDFTVSDDVVQQVARRVPVVTIGRNPVAGCDALNVDNTDPARELARHLLEHGRHTLQFVGDPDMSRDVAGRYAGYLQALSESGANRHPEPIRASLDGTMAPVVVERLMARIRQVDAIMCANDELALAVMQGLQRRGVHVPDDVAVTGWDDILAARYSAPGLTTVRQPTAELGARVAERLHTRITTPRAPVEHLVLEARPVVRDSCGVH